MTAPQRLAVPDFPEAAGRLGFAGLPKSDADIKIWAAVAPSAVICLAPECLYPDEHGFDTVDGAKRAGLVCHCLPIEDYSVPLAETLERWKALAPRLAQSLRAGEGLIILCKAGFGRSGMMTARLMVEMGVDPEEAITRIRTARPGAIETPEQEDFVRLGRPAPIG